MIKKRTLGIWLTVAVALTLAVAVVLNIGLSNAEAPSQYSAEDYADGTLSRLIGEEAAAKFEHNHPPITCTEMPFCTEVYFHRFEIGGLVTPESSGEAAPGAEQPIAPTATPTLQVNG